MSKSKLIALVGAVVLGLAGAYFGVDAKGLVCGDVEPQAMSEVK